MDENSVPIMEQTHSIAIQTNASRLDWGTVCQGQTTGSHWSTEEQAQINVLEMKAARLAIQSYLKKDLCQLPGGNSDRCVHLLDWIQWTSFIYFPIVLLNSVQLNRVLLFRQPWYPSNFRYHRRQSSCPSARQLFPNRRRR